MRFVFLALVLSFSSLAACAGHTARPSVQMVVVDPSLNQFAALWQTEIDRRFPNSLAILCHGGEFVEGEWVVRAPFGNKEITKAADLVKHYKKLHPTRTIVLLACNPGHIKLGVPGVYYSHSSVWCVPDRAVMSHSQNRFLKTDGATVVLPAGFANEDRNSIEPEIVGNIWEFGRDEDQ